MNPQKTQITTTNQYIGIFIFYFDDKYVIVEYLKSINLKIAFTHN